MNNAAISVRHPDTGETSWLGKVRSYAHRRRGQVAPQIACDYRHLERWAESAMNMCEHVAVLSEPMYELDARWCTSCGVLVGNEETK